MLARHLTDAQNGKRSRIANWLIEMPCNAREIGCKVGGGKLERVMMRADFPCGFGSALQLGILGAEADGERLHGAALEFLRVSDDGSAVQAAAQKHPNRHIRAQVQLYGVVQRAFQFFGGGFEGSKVRWLQQFVAPIAARSSLAWTVELQLKAAASG